MNINKQLCALAVFLASPGVSLAGSSPAKAKSETKAEAHKRQNELAPEISLKEMKELIERKDHKQMVIIDANSQSSYSSGHIPGAVHFAKVQDNLSAVLPPDKNAMIVAYCGSPMCTAWEEPAQKIKELGYTNIRHLKAGIKGWKDAKYPTQTL